MAWAEQNSVASASIPGDYPDHVVSYRFARVGPSLASVMQQVGSGITGGTLVLNYDTGDFSQFSSVQIVDPAVSLTFDSSLTRHSTGLSGHFKVRPGDDPLHLGSNTERAEILGPSFNEGDDIYFGWSTWLPDPGLHPTDIASTTVGMVNEFTALHENRGANKQFPTTAAVPPISFNIDTNTVAFPYHINVHVNGGPLDSNLFPASSNHKYDIGTVPYNQWVDWVMHVKHSSDPAIGQFQLWKNGVSVIGPLTTPTMYPDRQNYFKQGYYRTGPVAVGAPSATTEIWHDETRIGATYNDVDPSVTH